ncbi:retropepsin-like aspartic protease [Sphingobium nicotianae]|uniref:Retroviral-like aspartic protease family protein n=1 Tax=Sphingobium nicotianae TaxID=2782607 RepID=A0A9X1IR22_9SPHN|nr:retropepsin-like aspartic protease [Sphingobium nicotianae]MBT2186885.1 retroviral-like aspartic protease family protein [Sphingobium nicotianae]
MGATAVAFGEEQKARSFLEPLLNGKQAADAHGWLSYLDLRKGRYRAAAMHIAASEPGQTNPLAVTLQALPDQITVQNASAIVRHRIFQRKLFVPVSVNDHPAELILDSDANLSFLSESAAKRMGLTIRDSDATTAGALGAASRLRITIADIRIGKTHVRNVAFMVLPDNASLFAPLAPLQQGALGLPVMLALERMSWDSDGSFRIGAGHDPTRPSSPLAFDGADPIVRFFHDRVALAGVFDTGAETTDLWPPFAARFAEQIRKEGTAGKKMVRGFGGNGEIPEVVVPDLPLDMGGIPLRARPAHILTATTTANSDWQAGRLGLDLLRQARRVTIDFRANRLQLLE